MANLEHGKVLQYSQGDFVAWSEKFYDVGKTASGDRILRQGANFRFTSIDDLLILTDAMAKRSMYHDVRKALQKIDEKQHNYRSLCQLAGASLYCRKPEDAQDYYQKALYLSPDGSDARLGLANVALTLGHDDIATHHVDTVLSQDPACVAALNIQSMLALHGGDVAEFDRLMQRCISQSDTAGFQHNYAIGLLSVGEWTRGWAAYAKRESYRIPYLFRNHSIPDNLEDLRGKKICLIVEQAFGDIIQFIRFTQVCVEVGADVHIRCPSPLHRLFQTLPSPITCHRKVEHPDDFDFVLPLFSIPALLNWDDTDAIHSAPYLAAERDLITKWKSILDNDFLNVVIAWQGNPLAAVDIGRSLPPQYLPDLLDVPGVHFHSVQLGDPLDEARAAGLTKNLIVHAGLDDGDDAFVDTAALMAATDLVVSTDTSVAHVAGALGVPNIIMLKKRPDWRWQQVGQKTPWYPNTTLVRQPTFNDWGTVVAETKRLITQHLRKKHERQETR